MMRAQTPEAKTKRMFEEYTGTFAVSTRSRKRSTTGTPGAGEEVSGGAGRSEGHNQQLKNEY